MKPLNERTQGTENAYLGWSDNQLFRRPPTSAGGCDPGPWHYVGDPGEPPFEGDWANDLYLTRFRQVCDETEIELSCEGTGGSTIFTLPVGYRPGTSQPGIVSDGTSTGAQGIVVFSDGTVNAL